MFGKSATPFYLSILSTILLTALPGYAQPVSKHMKLGIPSKATKTGNLDNRLIVRGEYVLSYNNSKRIPNWVSWQLNNSWLGKYKRSNVKKKYGIKCGFWKCEPFRHDEDLPSEAKEVNYDSYTGVKKLKLARGHMCPSADRTSSVANMRDTFFMSNMVPQSTKNNSGSWAKFEKYLRKLVKGTDKEIYVIAGAYGRRRDKLNDDIIIPRNVWKVAVVLSTPGGRDDVKDDTRVIAIDIPNYEVDSKTPWQDFITTVDEIEKQTGYDLLDKVNEDVQKVIESKYDPFNKDDD